MDNNKEKEKFINEARKKISEIQDMIEENELGHEVMFINMIAVINDLDVESEEAMANTFFAFNVYGKEELKALIPHLLYAYDQAQEEHKGLDDFLNEFGISLN
jgi:hypothetical protein